MPELHRVAIEPAESAVLSGGEPGTSHRGRRNRLRPPLLAEDDVDELASVATAVAFDMARRAAREEGLWSGPSTGANLTVALSLAQRLGPGKRVVTPLVDSGLKYLAGELYS